jgi:hypothetical protein
MLPWGAGLLFVGGFEVWIMSVTQTSPGRILWSRRGWRREHDPKAWERYLIFYGVMAGVGALMILISLVTRL